jgi:hypothetical protein
MQEQIKTKTNSNQNLNKNNKDIDAVKKTVMPEEITKMLSHKYSSFFSKLEKIRFYDNAPLENRYIVDLDRGIMTSVSHKAINNKIREINDRHMAKVIIFRRIPILLVSKKKYKPEILDFFTRVIPDYYTTLTNSIDTMYNISQKISEVSKSDEFRIIFLDFLIMMANIREGYFTPMKVISTLLTVFTMHSRVNAAKRRLVGPQSYGLTFNDLALFASFGVSSKTIDRLKGFMTLTGKKITDCTALMDLISNFITVLHTLIGEAINAFPVLEVLRPVQKLMAGLMEYFLLNGKLKRVSENYAEFVKCPQVMFDAIYRNRILELYSECSGDPAFLAYVVNSSNKYAGIVWKAFNENVVKFAKTYDVTSRREPICLVFDGPPGCGKTGIVNKLSQLLREMNKSIYVHTCPTVEGGKDFYDDYNNEEVMMMDDVGQQGVSQWKNIINFVSPIKFPLMCAQADNKNTKFFNSGIIICTTNNFENLSGFTKADCISTPEALFRRVHLINVRRSKDLSSFKQDLTYKKFDHIKSKKWETTFLHENADINLDCINEDMTDDEAMTWLVSLIQSLEECREDNSQILKLSSSQVSNILSKATSRVKRKDKFYDARTDVNPQLFECIWDGAMFGYEMLTEWTQYISTYLQSKIDLQSILDNIMSANLVQLFSGLTVSIVTAAIGKFVWDACFSRMMIASSPLEVWETKLKAFEKERDMYVKQSGNDDEIPAHIKLLTKHSRILKYDVSGKTYYTHAIVSGEYVVVPSHVEMDNVYVDIYQSWEHMRNKHVEAERVNVQKVKGYLTVDIAIYKFTQFPVLYKKIRTLFTETSTRSPYVYMILSNKIIKMLRGKHVSYNTSSVVYSAAAQEYIHPEYTGFDTPLSAVGFCGGFLADAAGIVIGMHVAGDDSNGFCVQPSEAIASEINGILSNSTECEFDIDTEVTPGISGVRLRYEQGEILKKYPIARTSLAPTVFHADYNTDVKGLMKEMDLRQKSPPIVENSIKAVETAVLKTFSHQGDITNEEDDYIERALSLMIPSFKEISWDEVAFGNADLPPINKDSSNGYGMKAGKDNYINYEEKYIYEETLDMLESFKNQCEDGTVKISSMLGVESIKDELRLPDKVKDPRTFRVVPLTHMMWSKKILGEVAVHIKRNMHKTGICSGFNPYKDMHILAEKLNDCDVTCDVDFKKWDGSLIARIMKIVSRIFAKNYEGSNSAVLEVLMNNVFNSTVLVYDAVWRTTHGMPSGTWLTFLLNCLYNKALTAIVLYRNGIRDPSALFDVVDYVTGDDKICGSSGKYSKILNAYTIKEVAESLGMQCTNGDKTQITSPSMPFDKLNYLKREFRYSPKLDRWVGALSLETIMNTIQWFDNTKDYDEVLAGKCKSMQIEAFLHGDRFYNIYCKIIRKTAPAVMLFSEAKVINILNDDDGYRMVCGMSDKDISWM